MAVCASPLPALISSAIAAVAVPDMVEKERMLMVCCLQLLLVMLPLLVAVLPAVLVVYWLWFVVCAFVRQKILYRARS